MWLKKNIGNLLKRGKYTKQMMRLIATFLRNFRKITGQQDVQMWDVLTSANYKCIAYAVLTTATHDIEDISELKAPSNAVKMGFEIKRMISIKVAESVLSKKPEARADAEELLLVVNTYWATDVTKLAKTVLMDRQFNKVIALPVPEDVTGLNEYLNIAVAAADLTTKTADNYKQNANICGAKLALYNRRRPGEVENLT